MSYLGGNNVNTGNSRTKRQSTIAARAGKYFRTASGASNSIRSNDGKLPTDARKTSPVRSTISRTTTEQSDDPVDVISNAGYVIASDTGTRTSGGRTGRTGTGSRDNSADSRNSASGGNTGSSAETDTPSILGMDAEIVETPVIRRRKQRSDKGVKKGTRGTKSTDIDDPKAVFVGVLSIVTDTIYKTAAINNGEHWKLSPDENITLSLALHTALETLPGSAYENILEFAGKYGPWLALGWTAYNITKPRIDESRRINATKKKANDNSARKNITEFRDYKGFAYSPSPETNISNDGVGVVS